MPVSRLWKKSARGPGLAEGQRERIEQLSSDIERLRRGRDKARDELAEERAAKQELPGLVSRLRAEKESLEKDVVELRSQRDSLSEKLDRMDGERTSMRMEREQLKEVLLSNQQLLSHTELNLDNERKTTVRLSQEAQAHQETIASLRSAKDNLAEVRAQLSGAISETSALKAERNRLLNEIESRWDRL